MSGFAGVARENAEKEACIHGHPFDEENTRWRPNGHRSCRACAREQARHHRVRRRERVKAQKLRWTRANRPKVFAQRTLQRAVSAGRVVRPDACDLCGISDKACHGHHPDYSKPLDVEWLCPVCHAAAHWKQEAA